MKKIKDIEVKAVSVGGVITLHDNKEYVFADKTQLGSFKVRVYFQLHRTEGTALIIHTDNIDKSEYTSFLLEYDEHIHAKELHKHYDRILEDIREKIAVMEL